MRRQHQQGRDARFVRRGHFEGFKVDHAVRSLARNVPALGRALAQEEIPGPRRRMPVGVRHSSAILRACLHTEDVLRAAHAAGHDAPTEAAADALRRAVLHAPFFAKVPDDTLAHFRALADWVSDWAAEPLPDEV